MNRAIAKMLGTSHQSVGRDAGPNGPAKGKRGSKNGDGKQDGGPNGPPVLAGAAAAQLVARREDRKARDAEAGEKHWARAKDPSKLFDAIAAKVKAQAEYVCWRDGKVKHGGDRKSKNQDRADANLIPDGDPGHDIASRWRKSFCLKGETGTIIDQEKMRLALDDAQARALRVVEQQPKGTERGTAGTGEFERYTPAEYIEAARQDARK